MRGNNISKKPLSESGRMWLEKTLQVLQIKDYGKGSIRNYIQELTLLFKFYNDISVENIRQEHIEQ